MTKSKSIKLEDIKTVLNMIHNVEEEPLAIYSMFGGKKKEAHEFFNRVVREGLAERDVRDIMNNGRVLRFLSSKVWGIGLQVISKIIRVITSILYAAAVIYILSTPKEKFLMGVPLFLYALYTIFAALIIQLGTDILDAVKNHKRMFLLPSWRIMEDRFAIRGIICSKEISISAIESLEFALDIQSIVLNIKTKDSHINSVVSYKMSKLLPIYDAIVLHRPELKIK